MMESLAPQRSKDWHKLRATHITASTCAAVLNASPWISRQDFLERKAYEKVYGRVEIPPNAPMLEGIRDEPRVIEMSKPYVIGFTDMEYREFGYKVHDKYNFIGASPDSLIYDGDKLVSGLEVKKQFSRGKKTLIDWLPIKKKNLNYWMQCQLSMEVFDVDTWHFFATNFNWGGHELIPRDRQWFAESLPRFLTFMDELEALIEKLRHERANAESKVP